MPGSLVDTSVWLAALFSTHQFYPPAKRCLLEATPATPVFFCRSTQQSFLRLASTPTVLQAYGAAGLTNRDALSALDSLMALPQVRVSDEPPGTFQLWQRLAARDTASPKVWMDAYLAAFAISGGLRLASLDRDFQNFTSFGLQFDLIRTA